MICETKVISHIPASDVGHWIDCSCQPFSMSTKSVLFAQKFCKECNWLLKCPLFDFEYCVMLIYKLKMSDRAGFVEVTFGF